MFPATVLFHMCLRSNRVDLTCFQPVCTVFISSRDDGDNEFMNILCNELTPNVSVTSYVASCLIPSPVHNLGMRLCSLLSHSQPSTQPGNEAMQSVVHYKLADRGNDQYIHHNCY